MKKIYLDYAAATPVNQTALKAMQPYLRDSFYNPSAVYLASRSVHQDLETARAKVAAVLGVKDQEIYFTAGGTEANNLAISGVMRRFPDGEMLYSAIEHESVITPAQKYQARILPVSDKGVVDIATLEAVINDKTVLISVMYANNEVGTIQPIKEIAEIIKSERAKRLAKGQRRPIYLHTDACQAANYLDLNVARLGVDMMTLNGGKIYAMKQSGCLYVNRNVEIEALISGGGQESGLRSGTENVASVMAFAAMLVKVQKKRKSEAKRISVLRDQLFATISQKITDVRWNGHQKRLPNNLNITIPNVDGERLVMELDEAGIMAATGSACSASHDQPSHVLLAMGLSVAEASASLRLTLGEPNTEEDIYKAGKIMTNVISKHKRLV